jgi:hypothetical protein
VAEQTDCRPNRRMYEFMTDVVEQTYLNILIQWYKLGEISHVFC